MKIQRRSPLTGQINTLDLPSVTEDKLHRWQHGQELIQDVFPDLSNSEREFLMTGYTDEDWEKLFPKGEE